MPDPDEAHTGPGAANPGGQALPRCSLPHVLPPSAKDTPLETLTRVCLPTLAGPCVSPRATFLSIPLQARVFGGDCRFLSSGQGTDSVTSNWVTRQALCPGRPPEYTADSTTASHQTFITRLYLGKAKDSHPFQLSYSTPALA